MSATVIALRPKLAPALPDQLRKAFASRQAQLALRGVPLERLADGSYIAEALFGHIALRDLAAVDAFLAELE